MAKEEKSDAAGAPKKTKKLLIIVLAAVFILVLAGGGAAYFLLKSGADADDEEAVSESASSKKKAEKALPPVFVPLETFTVNLVPETGEQYLQVVISIETDDPAIAEQVKLYTPRLRHEIMDILSSKKASEVATREGKKALADEILLAIRAIVEPSAKGKKAVGSAIKAVLFTTFIIQ